MFLIYELDTQTSKLPENFGIIVNAPNQETTILELDSLYAKTSALGANRSNVYVFWDTFEPAPRAYNWALIDAIMSFHVKHNLDATVFFSIVNGKTIGPLPNWMDSPTLDALSADFVSSAISAIGSRYSDVIDSVIIAGDSDAYFEKNPNMIDAYNELFNNVCSTLHDTNPELNIGNGFSLDRMINRGTQDVASLITVGDFVAFTYRPVNLLNEIAKEPQQVLMDLDEMSIIANGAPIALFEIGWSSSELIGGSDADQTEFITKLVEFTQMTDIEFVTWYRLHDKP